MSFVTKNRFINWWIRRVGIDGVVTDNLIGSGPSSHGRLHWLGSWENVHFLGYDREHDFIGATANRE